MEASANYGCPASSAISQLVHATRQSEREGRAGQKPADVYYAFDMDDLPTAGGSFDRQSVQNHAEWLESTKKRTLHTIKSTGCYFATT